MSCHLHQHLPPLYQDPVHLCPAAKCHQGCPPTKCHQVCPPAVCEQECHPTKCQQMCPTSNPPDPPKTEGENTGMLWVLGTCLIRLKSG
uniref:Uncharacterized protein n=1 Tax=Geospiza parvula TaxID=87175 RepID=A0A8C3Q7K6_GEOPR